MAQIIKFFSNQAVCAPDNGASNSLYSEIFNVEHITKLAVQFRLHMISSDVGWPVSAVVETCNDPRLNGAIWSSVGELVGHDAPSQAYSLLTGLKRFLRARVIVATQAGYSGFCSIISLCGVARSPMV